VAVAVAVAVAVVAHAPATAREATPAREHTLTERAARLTLPVAPHPTAQEEPEVSCL
jgi:hypothetical protein